MIKLHEKRPKKNASLIKSLKFWGVLKSPLHPPSCAYAPLPPRSWKSRSETIYYARLIVNTVNKIWKTNILFGKKNVYQIFMEHRNRTNVQKLLFTKKLLMVLTQQNASRFFDFFSLLRDIAELSVKKKQNKKHIGFTLRR